ncbi:MAG: hypothetical protein QXK12_02065 [Candidatus Nezhaarchaeales archaeon]
MLKVPRSLILRVVQGIIYGGIFYIVYVMLFPILFRGLGLPVEYVSTDLVLSALALFVGLSIITSISRGTAYSFVFNALKKLLGLLILVEVLNGGLLSTSIIQEGVRIHVSLDVSPIVYLLAAWTLTSIVLDAFDMVKR